VEQVREPVALEDQDAARLMPALHEALVNGESFAPVGIAALAGSGHPHAIMVSASDSQAPAHVAIGTGPSFDAAIRDAISRLWASMPEPSTAHWLRLDVIRPTEGRELMALEKNPPIERTLEGVVFAREIATALLPIQLAANQALSRDGYLHADKLPASLQSQLFPGWKRLLARFFHKTRTANDASLIYSPFVTDGFFYDGETTHRLFRESRMPAPIDRERLWNAATLAGGYLQNAIGADGRFAYRYSPERNAADDDYNLLRHAGTVYSMLELYELTEDTVLLDAARRGIRYLLQFVRPFEGDSSNASILVSEDKVKLGGIALTLLALAKHQAVTGDDQYLALMRRLARYIRQSQRPDGSFVSMRFYPSMAERTDFESQYYPGEAILALLRLHALDPQPDWLDIAERGALYLITIRDRDRHYTQLPHDHWLLYALNELYRQRPDIRFLDHAMRIALAITLSQILTAPHPDFVGGYSFPPRSTPTAARSEGLIAAHALAVDYERPIDAMNIRKAIERGLQHQLQTQILPEKAMFLPNPLRALGGFQESLTDFTVQIDGVQHNLSAILGYYRLLSSEQQ
jgi:hypothetical protein